MRSIIRFFSLSEMALCGVPLDQSRPGTFLQMINNFTFTTVAASRGARKMGAEINRFLLK